MGVALQARSSEGLPAMPRELHSARSITEREIARATTSVRADRARRSPSQDGERTFRGEYSATNVSSTSTLRRCRRRRLIIPHISNPDVTRHLTPPMRLTRMGFHLSFDEAVDNCGTARAWRRGMLPAAQAFHFYTSSVGSAARRAAPSTSPHPCARRAWVSPRLLSGEGTDPTNRMA